MRTLTLLAIFLSSVVFANAADRDGIFLEDEIEFLKKKIDIIAKEVKASDVLKAHAAIGSSEHKNSLDHIALTKAQSELYRVTKEHDKLI
ncbi:MAG: hypothetical protein LBP59_02705, partial [Planctomycetaceae bacterium]|nr:hypothetical protein [Planctomycetaceae bacterium]